MASRRRSAQLRSKFIKSGAGRTIANLRGPQMLLIALFAVVFAGAGLYVVGRSSAASEGCVLNTYSTSLSGEYVTCVKSLQTVLDNWQTADVYQIIPAWRLKPAPDGYYGNITKTGVEDFQKWNNSKSDYQPYRTLAVDGIAGHQTWKDLCWWGGYNLHGSGNISVNTFALDDAGCWQYFHLEQ